MKLSIILLLGLSLFFGFKASAQTDTVVQDQGKLTVNLGTDLMSRYIWRGTQFSTGPSVQPTFELAMGGLAIGSWGAYSFHGTDGAEADLYLSYTTLKEMVTFTFTDYFFPDETGAPNKYFNYAEKSTGHIFELGISFNGTEKLPLSLLVAANLFGADAKRLNNTPSSPDFNTEIGNMYSVYAELGYSLNIKDVGVDIFAGFTPTSPKEADNQTGFIGETGFYGEKMGFVNIGATASKEIKITDSFSLPVSASVITNPMTENIYFVFGVSL